MKRLARLELHPSGRIFKAEIGSPLVDVLFGQGVEFPCGGRGQCMACRVKVLSGDIPATAREHELLSFEEIRDGWRMACLGQVAGDAVLEVAQWDAPVLSDESQFSFEPRDGVGVAVDVGTTTLAAQVLDLRTGTILASETALNPQSRYGADLMSRLHAAVADGLQDTLQQTIRTQIGDMIVSLMNAARRPLDELAEVVLVGNTAMHHLFCGLNVAPLTAYPFEPADLRQQVMEPARLGWAFAGGATVRFLSCIGGFVGSDLLAGILATEMDSADELVALIDLGTNGEIIIGNRKGILCASTAAGPAFEGACISSGMRASSGAIGACVAESGRIACRVIGGGRAMGVCGSGLVDAVAAGLDLGLIAESGRVSAAIPLADGVSIVQSDIRHLQLAKAAIAAGIDILLERLNARREDVSKVFLAGAFGNYIGRKAARRIGLLDFDEDRLSSAGNTALHGAKIALSTSTATDRIASILSRCRHVALGADLRFQEVYVEQMSFSGGLTNQMMESAHAPAD